MPQEFFPQRPDAKPMIYAYTDNNPIYAGQLKIGYTAGSVEQRVAQQYPTLRPGGKPYNIVFAETAMYEDGESFTDHAIHKYLRRHGFTNTEGEWFVCTVNDLKAAYLAVKTKTENDEGRIHDFRMRPEQEEAVLKTRQYFESVYEPNSARPPKFLWNAKMRFGKTFAAYELAKKMGFKRILILTFKPVVKYAWSEDLLTHKDFEGWQFISRDSDLTYEKADKSRPIVCFGSFQDYLGVDKATGRIKARNEWVHTENFDLVIFDEYHFGAWKENAKSLFEENDDEYDTDDLEHYNRGNAYDETFLPITSLYYLYLSGTPFRAINTGEFIEDQIYNWTYGDEQRAKENWVGDNNPYAALPRMVLMTYKIPDSIKQIAMQGEFNEFDINMFFSAKGTGKDAKFVYENEVQKWLDLIRGAYMPTATDDLKLGSGRPAMPYSDARLLNVLQHTLWFLPNVASCDAMCNLLAERQNVFYHDYKVNNCAGTKAGIGADALPPVLKSMDNPNPLECKTITLSCGKLTTGVTVRPWTGIFMLRNLSTPETYFQSAFRVQSPWETKTDSGRTEIIKKECYVFDFALDRALRQVSDYGRSLNTADISPERKVADFISFLPVIAYDGSSMRQIDAAEILDITMAGTSATLLARRWESALLVNVDNDTLKRLMDNPEAMKALMNIEGFRSLNSDIETIINKSEAVKKAKKEGTDTLTPKEKKELTEAEKEFKTKRKQIQEKLIKFSTRIPIFMYLTDYREQTLLDVIRQLEPGLFKKVTGLSTNDFELLVSLGVFNSSLMSDAIYKFRRYEDSSLSYTGIDRHAGEDVGGWDTVLRREEYESLYSNQQDSMVAPERAADDIHSNPFAFIGSYDDDDEDSKKEVVKKIRDLPKAPPTTFVNIPVNKPEEEKKPEVVLPQIDCSGVQAGSILIHKAFGEGKVIKIENGIVAVAFDGGKSQKMFQFPGAIQQGFLTIK